MDPAGMVCTYVWSVEIRIFVMTTCAHVLELVDGLDHRLWQLFYCVVGDCDQFRRFDDDGFALGV